MSQGGARWQTVHMGTTRLLPTSAPRRRLRCASLGSAWLEVTNPATVESRQPPIINPCCSGTHLVMEPECPKGCHSGGSLRHCNIQPLELQTTVGSMPRL